jgi:hypothetical protein
VPVGERRMQCGSWSTPSSTTEEGISFDRRCRSAIAPMLATDLPQPRAKEISAALRVSKHNVYESRRLG